MGENEREKVIEIGLQRKPFLELGFQCDRSYRKEERAVEFVKFFFHQLVFTRYHMVPLSATSPEAR